MKLATLVFGLSVLASTVTLTACSDSAPAPTPPPAAPPASTPQTPETAPEPPKPEPAPEPQPEPPVKADPPATDEPDPDVVVEESGRKWSKSAVAMLEKAAKLQHLPGNYGVSELSGIGNAKFSFAGQPPIDIVATPAWKNGEPFQVGIELPQELADSDMGPMMQGTLETYFRLLLEHFYTGPTESLAMYDVTLREKKGEKSVRLVPTGDAVDYERRDLWFDEEGRVSKEVFTLHVTGDDMASQSMVGAEFELSLTYEKAGELELVRSLSLFTPMGDMQLDATYHELDGGKRLFPKVLTVKMAMFPEPVDLTIGSYTIDGTLADETVIPEEDADEDGGTEEDAGTETDPGSEDQE